MRAPRAVWGLVIAGLFAFGSSPILVRYAGEAPALTLAFWRTVTVALVLAPAALTSSRREIAAFTGREWALVLGAGVLLGLHFMAWIGSVQLTSVASAAVLVTMSPVFIVVLGALVLGERPRGRTVAAIAFAIVGAALIALASSGEGVAFPNAALGNAIALGAAVLVSGYLVIGRAVRRETSFVAYFAPLNAAAAVTCGVGCVIAGEPLTLPLAAAGLAIAMGLGPGLLGHGSFAVALRYLPAAFLGLLSLAEPVLASAFAAVAFGEVPNSMALVGMVVVLASIATVTVRAR